MMDLGYFVIFMIQEMKNNRIYIYVCVYNFFNDFFQCVIVLYMFYMYPIYSNWPLYVSQTNITTLNDLHIQSSTSLRKVIII